MFKRLLWLAVGVGFGALGAYFLARKVRDVGDRYGAGAVAGRVGGRFSAISAELAAAFGEGLEAMAEREAELRLELGMSTK